MTPRPTFSAFTPELVCSRPLHFRQCDFATPTSWRSVAARTRSVSAASRSVQQCPLESLRNNDARGGTRPSNEHAEFSSLAICLYSIKGIVIQGRISDLERY